MAVKMGDFGAAEALSSGLWKKPMALRSAKYVGSFLLGLAMGAGRLFSGCGPFGIAVVGCLGTDISGLLCLFGAMLGYLLVGGLVGSMRYLASTLLVFTASLVLRGVRLAAQSWFMPLLASAFTLLTWLLYRGDITPAVPALLRLVAELLLVGVGYSVFSSALLGGRLAADTGGQRRSVSLAILGACALTSLARVGLFEAVYLGPFFSLLAVMLAAFGGGPLLGCAVGAGFGLAMDAAVSPSLFRTAAYAFAALVSGLMARRGRLAFSLCFCTANALAVLFAWNNAPQITALYECFAAVVLFMLLPSVVVNPVSAMLRGGHGDGDSAFRRYQAARLERMSEAFGRMFEFMRSSAVAEEGVTDTEVIFDRSADAVCHDCGSKDLCWNLEYMETLAALQTAAEPMLARGSLREDDLPESFRLRCQRSESFVGAVNGELRAALYRRRFQCRLQDAKTAAFGQFSDLSRVMHSAARELCGPAGPDAGAEARLGRFLKSVNIDGSCSVFSDSRGRMRVAIDSAGVAELAEDMEFLEKLSAVLGVRLSRLSCAQSDRLLFIQTEPLAVSVGMAAMKKEGESISGDRCCYFKTDAGLLCLILSDGMGCGARAAVESSAAVKILEELLRAGVEPETAMRLLNAMVMLKNGEDWSYATVDLCCVDLFSGQSCFYKYGAAPSYIKTGRAIRRIKARSLAAGMQSGEGAAPDVIKMRLRPGNVAIIASDGVMAEDSDQWLREILAGSDGAEMKLLARQVLEAARRRFGNTDDMTALAIRVEERP